MSESITGMINSVIEVKGNLLAKGPKGDKGDPGYTPQKGIDYFTPEDISEIADDIETVGQKTPEGGEIFNNCPDNKATGNHSHAEGFQTHANGRSSHAEGFQTHANGRSSHAEGHGTNANGEFSHAEGVNTRASGGCHAEGQNTLAKGWCSHAEGFETRAEGNYSHAAGYGVEVNGDCATGIGKYNKKKRVCSVSDRQRNF